VAILIADTDVVIDTLRGIGHHLPAMREALRRRALHVTAITRVELAVGTGSTADERLMQRFLRPVHVLPLDARAAETAGRVRRELRARGEDIGFADCCIAGIVLARDGTLLTGNRRHFERVPGLSLASAPDGDPR
jgi:tRNA(fMet)-specific endonuclease VapC